MEAFLVVLFLLVCLTATPFIGIALLLVILLKSKKEKRAAPQSHEWVCRCGRKNRELAKFCQGCGARNSNAHRLCPKGHDVRLGAKFCQKCGQPTS